MTSATITPSVRAPRFPVVHKDQRAQDVPPNMIDYDRTCATFSWAEARGELTGLPEGAGLNIAYEAADRHAAGSRASHVALRWLGKRGDRRDVTYAQLSA